VRQIQKIQKGLQEADSGKFASDEEVAKVVSKWKKAR
jgi:predicted transcriptional regulator